MRFTQRLSEHSVQVAKDLEAILDPVSVQVKRVTEWVKGVFNSASWYQQPAELYGVQHWNEMFESGVMKRTKYRYREEMDEKIIEKVFDIVSEWNVYEGPVQVRIGIPMIERQQKGFFAESVVIAKVTYKVLQHCINPKLQIYIETDCTSSTNAAFKQFLKWISIVRSESGMDIAILFHDIDSINERDVDICL